MPLTRNEEINQYAKEVLVGEIREISREVVGTLTKGIAAATFIAARETSQEFSDKMRMTTKKDIYKAYAAEVEAELDDIKRRVLYALNNRLK